VRRKQAQGKSRSENLQGDVVSEVGQASGLVRPVTGWRTDRVLKLDVNGDFVMMDGVPLTLRIRNLSLEEKICVLDFVVSELSQALSAGMLHKFVVDSLNRHVKDKS